MRSFRIALLIAFAGLAAPAAAHSFLGTWTATAKTPQGNFSEEVTATKTDDGYAITVKTIDPLPEGTPAAGPGWTSGSRATAFPTSAKSPCPTAASWRSPIPGT